MNAPGSRRHWAVARSAAGETETMVMVGGTGPSVIATGAWLKNAACALDAEFARMSPLHGDLGTPAACDALESTVAGWVEAGGVPDVFAHDLHPDFHSTRVAETFARRFDVPAIGVQHHHAHIAAVAAEHGCQAPLLGIALDGVGLGIDGTAWGGELLQVDGASFARVAHLAPIRLAGGDRAAREPWRLLLALGVRLGAQGAAAAIGEESRRIVNEMLDRDLNCPRSSAAGRWFDAAAAATGVCMIQQHEAQAAMALESAAEQWLESHGGIDAGAAQLGFSPAARLVRDSLDPTALVIAMAGACAANNDANTVGREAARFHLGLADALAAQAGDAASRLGIDTVALGGGCWFNRILSDRVRSRLGELGLRVLGASAVSSGDAGVALGQAWVARHQLEID